MDLEVLALVTPNGGTPCGSCRQVMVEFNPDMLVLIADGEGRLLQETTVAGLLPGAFTQKDMKK
jgi:cytidine deaminase